LSVSSIKSLALSEVLEMLFVWILACGNLNVTAFIFTGDTAAARNSNCALLRLPLVQEFGFILCLAASDLWFIVFRLCRYHSYLVFPLFSFSPGSLKVHNDL